MDRARQGGEVDEHAEKHAQGRLTTATQLKLDEILRSLPQADDALVKAETAADEEPEQQAERNLRYRNHVQSPGASADTDG